MSERKISDKEVEALKMSWKDVEAKGIKPVDKKLLDTLAATFMLTDFGRPGFMFNKDENILNKDKFYKLEDNHANHQYLSDIAVSLLKKNVPLLQIKQLFTLIQDLDSEFSSGNSPYTGEFQGFQKWDHPDFANVRKATKKYFQNLIKNPGKKEQAYKGLSTLGDSRIERTVSLIQRVAGLDSKKGK